MSAVASAVSTRDRERTLHRRVRLLVAATITYNVIEGVIAVTAGSIAGSAALVGFGLDSTVEVLSAAVVAWQFAAPDHRTREATALRLVATSFFVLAAYVALDAGRALVTGAEPDPSTVGIGLAAVSLAVMPGLSWFERRTGRELGSPSVVANSKQTLVCSYLSAVLLGGLLANRFLGWAWADPLAALVIALVAVREGRAARRGDACCTSPTALLDETDDECCGSTAL